MESRARDMNYQIFIKKLQGFYTFLWCFLLSACKPLHIFYCKKIHNDNIRSIRCHDTKSSSQSNQAPGICAPLLKTWGKYLHNLMFLYFVHHNF